jgi:isopenicillin N synthase-like dioxygenase
MAATSVVPVIDLARLIEGTPSGKREVAEQIRNACQDIGFFVIRNHGVSSLTISRAWDSIQQFFDLPTEKKLRYKTDDEAKYPYGYSPIGGEVLSKGKERENECLSPGLSPGSAAKKAKKSLGDLKEMMCLGPSNEASGAMPRRVPEEPTSFNDTVGDYYSAMEVLASRVLGAFAIALELPEDFFEPKMDRHLSALRAINYPSLAGVEVPPGAVRASAHTDYGTITILKSGGPGLQVSKDRDEPFWYDVPHLEDAFVINLGDLMRRWTNDKWCSTLHRVINPPKDEAETWGRRQSLAFFHNLNADARVEVIPTCITPDSPQLYEAINAKEFLMLKHLASMGKAPQDAHLQRIVLA